ncbi:MAG: DUF2851 family protein [Balneolales bacterium]
MAILREKHFLIRMTENLFQHIWSGLYFGTAGLKTTCGQSVAIVDQGTLNDGDGPDFRKSEICIDGLSLFGDVELHLHPEDWANHQHNTDPRYNQVILHVILSGLPVKPATRADGTLVPCLVLQPHISNQLNDVLEYTRQKQEMACSGMLHLISPDIIEAQFKKAHHAYFEYRIEQLMRLFDPSLSPSIAWKRMLVAGLFEGLGYTRNKTPMGELCRLLFKNTKADDSLEAIGKKAMALSGIYKTGASPSIMNKTSWDFSASRPANQPPSRIRQGAAIYFNLFEIPDKSWLVTDPLQLWEQLMQFAGTGKERTSLIFGTVFLPALHILGNLFHDNSLMNLSFSAWMNQKSNIPAPIANAYKKSGFPEGNYKRKLGAVYQYKHICRESRCESCFVMQKLLQA